MAKREHEILKKLLLLSSAVLAAPEDVPDHDLSFVLKVGYILAEGVFVEDTAEKFKAFLAENGKADGTWNISLYIQSLGGPLDAAMEMG